MNVNGVIRSGGASPAESTVARKTTPVPKERAGAPELAVERDSEAPSVSKVLAARQAGMVRGGTRVHIDEATDQIVAQIISVNNEVIKQLPPEERLKITARFRQVVGVMFDRQV